MFILQALYFFLPAYVSNMIPVILGKYNIFPQPIDSNKKQKDKPILGAHKTWGGLLYGTMAGTLTFGIQTVLYTIPTFQQVSLINYATEPIMIGVLLALGALAGDAIKSFFKRRLNKKSGDAWFPFDQIDYVIGALVFVSIYYVPEIKIIITLIIAAPLLHFTANHIAFFLGWKDVKW